MIWKGFKVARLLSYPMNNAAVCTHASYIWINRRIHIWVAEYARLGCNSLPTTTQKALFLPLKSCPLSWNWKNCVPTTSFSTRQTELPIPQASRQLTTSNITSTTLHKLKALQKPSFPEGEHQTEVATAGNYNSLRKNQPKLIHNVLKPPHALQLFSTHCSF